MKQKHDIVTEHLENYREIQYIRGFLKLRRKKSYNYLYKKNILACTFLDHGTAAVKLNLSLPVEKHHYQSDA